MTDSDDDHPGSMRDPEVRARRKAMLGLPHVNELTAFINEMREREGRPVPDVDPLDGGVKAQALFLLDTPGSEAKNSGFVSCNNPDDTAKYMRASWREAGLKRCRVLLWNVVPHCLENNSTKKQVREAIENTQAFIDKLPDLKVVVFCGEKAWSAKKYLMLSPNVVALFTCHTGGKAYHHHKRDIHDTFRTAARLLDKCKPAPGQRPS